MNAPIDVNAIRIETDRLVLRAWRESDAEDMYEYAKVDGVGQMAGWKPHEDLEESRRIVRMFMDEKKTFALELKENGKTIGSLGLEKLKDLDESYDHLSGREIGYAMSKDYWGRGLMPEAVKAVMEYCFQTLNYDFLSCCHFNWNPQSRRVIEKCGFSFLKNISYQTEIGVVESSKLYVFHNPYKAR